MKDSFNNEIQVGDRVLCIEPREFNIQRKNQIGTIAEMNYNRVIINYIFYGFILQLRCYHQPTSPALQG